MIGATHFLVKRLVTTALVLADLLPAAGAGPAIAASQTGTSGTAPLDLDFGHLPLYFVENRGQTDPRVAYTVLGGRQPLPVRELPAC